MSWTPNLHAPRGIKRLGHRGGLLRLSYIPCHVSLASYLLEDMLCIMNLNTFLHYAGGLLPY